MPRENIRKAVTIPMSAFFMAVFAVKQLGEAVTGRADDTATRE